MKWMTTIALPLALLTAGFAYAQADEMKGMDMGHQNKEGKDTPHRADGTVKAIDTVKSKLTLAHGPVKSLNWPAMTMAFSVKDKSLLDKVKVGQTVHVEFVKQGSDYIVTSVR